MTQRLVEGGGRSAIVSGLPSGPMTYLTLGRWVSVIGTLTNSTDKHSLHGENYRPRLKICLSQRRGPGKLCPDIANLLVTDGAGFRDGWTGCRVRRHRLIWALRASEDGGESIARRPDDSRLASGHRLCRDTGGRCGRLFRAGQAWAAAGFDQSEREPDLAADRHCARRRSAGRLPGLAGDFRR